MLHAPVASAGVGAFSQVHGGAAGDARGSSQNNLAAEFLGDYVYATATRTYGAAVWNDVAMPRTARPWTPTGRRCTTRRWTGAQTAEAEEPGGESRPDQPGDAPAEAPDGQQVGPATFGNSDIYGGSHPNP